jgi:hypothetical protein
VRSYFRDVPLRRVLVEEDDQMFLHGNLDGVVASSRCPLRAWKSMWRGMYRGMEPVVEDFKYLTIQPTVVNMRFDLFSSDLDPRMKNTENLSAFLRHHTRTPLAGNFFLYGKPEIFIDNFFLGNVTSMMRLVRHFHEDLDEIVTRYHYEINQEKIVFMENERV